MSSVFIIELPGYAEMMHALEEVNDDKLLSREVFEPLARNLAGQRIDAGVLFKHMADFRPEGFEDDWKDWDMAKFYTVVTLCVLKLGGMDRERFIDEATSKE